MIVRCQWQLEGPLHAGTGLSRGGYADRLIRVDLDGSPIIPGDAVKGAIRMSAERLLRWLGAPCADEVDDKSLPTHPVIRRIFQCDDRQVFYHFFRARRIEKGRSPFTISSTALDGITRTAKSETLRTMEASDRNDCFNVHIEAEGGTWSPGSIEWHDGLFLCAALLATDGLGAKRGAGFGRLSVSNATCDIPEWTFAGLALPSTIDSIREHLASEKVPA